MSSRICCNVNWIAGVLLGFAMGKLLDQIEWWQMLLVIAVFALIPASAEVLGNCHRDRP